MTETLQEYVDSRGVDIRVDREAGILRGVKLIGLLSKNGRRYRDSALAAAAGLYESAKVNVNHSKEGPSAPRDYQDRLGVIRNVEHRTGDGLFAELHFNPKHALAEQLVWDALHNPANVGLSHSVTAQLSREGTFVVVDGITHVQSVDLVADPAATHGLFEHAQQPAAEIPDAVWQELTVESLQLNRADLYETLTASATESVEHELQELRALERRQRREEEIVRVLEGLDPAAVHKTLSPRRFLGEALFDMLLSIDDDELLRRLIEERIDASRNAGPDLDRRLSAPRSVEQGGPSGRRTIDNGAEFARAIRTTPF